MGKCSKHDLVYQIGECPRCFNERLNEKSQAASLRSMKARIVEYTNSIDEHSMESIRAVARATELNC
jgi:hypothetical protein